MGAQMAPIRFGFAQVLNQKTHTHIYIYIYTHTNISSIYICNGTNYAYKKRRCLNLHCCVSIKYYNNEVALLHSVIHGTCIDVKVKIPHSSET